MTVVLVHILASISGVCKHLRYSQVIGFVQLHQLMAAYWCPLQLKVSHRRMATTKAWSKYVITIDTATR